MAKASRGPVTPSFEDRLHKFKDTIVEHVHELVEHAKKADVHLSDLKDTLGKIDTKEAKARLKKLQGTGLNELQRLRSVFHDEFSRLSAEVKKSSAKLKTESTKVRGRAADTLKTVQSQIRNIAQAERKKRRGRSRSE